MQYLSADGKQPRAPSFTAVPTVPMAGGEFSSVCLLTVRVKLEALGSVPKPLFIPFPPFELGFPGLSLGCLQGFGLEGWAPCVI